jgi:ubiquitin-conjugating enzyme E2 R
MPLYVELLCSFIDINFKVELRKNPETFKKRVKKICEKSRSELPPGFEMPKPKKQTIEKEEVFDPLADDPFYDEEEEDFGSEDEEMDENEDEEDD